jgi:HEPN domain-containing protein
MPAPKNAVLAVLREWIAKAEDDLTAATQILSFGNAAPTVTVCFHAQQCVEKYLKTVLVHRGIPFSKTHDIEALFKLVPRARRPALRTNEQRQLTSYAVVIRYPGGGLDIPLSEARHAAAIARRVRREIRRLLPRAALVRKK